MISLFIKAMVNSKSFFLSFFCLLEETLAKDHNEVF